MVLFFCSSSFRVKQFQLCKDSNIFPLSRSEITFAIFCYSVLVLFDRFKCSLLSKSWALRSSRPTGRTADSVTSKRRDGAIPSNMKKSRSGRRMRDGCQRRGATAGRDLQHPPAQRQGHGRGHRLERRLGHSLLIRFTLQYRRRIISSPQGTLVRCLMLRRRRTRRRGRRRRIIRDLLVIKLEKSFGLRTGNWMTFRLKLMMN